MSSEYQSIIDEIKKYRQLTGASLIDAKKAIEEHGSVDKALKAVGVDPTEYESPTKTNSATLTLSEGYPTICCQCGMEFILFTVLRSEEDGSERLMNQAKCDFCPYCGKSLRFEF